MSPNVRPRDEILQLLVRRYDCPLEELAMECFDLTWNQVLIEVDKLCRSGHIRLLPKGPAHYVVTLGEREVPTA
jgi:hypothetical protein